MSELEEADDWENDPMYQEAMAELIWALDDGSEHQKASAIDTLITVRIAHMMERIESRMMVEKE